MQLDLEQSMKSHQELITRSVQLYQIHVTTLLQTRLFLDSFFPRNSIPLASQKLA